MNILERAQRRLSFWEGQADYDRTSITEECSVKQGGTILDLKVTTSDFAFPDSGLDNASWVTAAQEHCWCFVSKTGGSEFDSTCSESVQHFTQLVSPGTRLRINIARPVNDIPILEMIGCSKVHTHTHTWWPCGWQVGVLPESSTSATTDVSISPPRRTFRQTVLDEKSLAANRRAGCCDSIRPPRRINTEARAAN